MRWKTTGGIEKKHRRTTCVSTTAIDDDTIEVYLDYDDLIASLKLPPPKLTWEDFANDFGLCSEGLNPHRWKKDHNVPEKKMEELFGKALGPQGRHGYHWADCKVTSVVDQITRIHPIVYQHPKNATPKLIANQFALGIAYEHFEKQPVSWAMFGQETNRTQQRTYLQDITKINWAKQEGIKVTTKSWRKLNVPDDFKATAFEQEGQMVKWLLLLVCFSIL